MKSTQIQLAQAVQQNTGVFSDAFHMVDAQIHVMQRVINDMAKGTTYVTADGGVDFSEYMAEYWGTLGFVEFVKEALKLAKPVEPVLANPNDEVHVFGGP